MISPIYDRIIVQVNPEQKDYAEFGGVSMFIAHEFNPNNREKAPVVAYVIKGNDEVKDGDFIIVHHNYFSDPSPFEIGGGMYSIPFTENIFAIIDKEGTPRPTLTNVIAERIEENEYIGLANPKRIHYHDRVKVVAGEGYYTGEEVFTLPFSDYEIVYNWNGIEKRIIRIFKDNIVAVLKNN